jgi:hypothetical protein
LITYLDYQAIPEQFLIGSNVPGTTDQLLFREAVGYLLDFSLITRGVDPKTYDVHPLSTETHISQNTDEAIHWKGRVLNVVSRLFHRGDYEDKDICAAYLSHVMAVIRYDEVSVSNSAKLLKNLGRYFLTVGQYSAAEDKVKRCHELRIKPQSNIHIATALLTAVLSAVSVWPSLRVISPRLCWTGKVIG